MKCTFLGTGPAIAIPRPGHTDPVCRAARKGGKSRRMRSAALLEEDNISILIDAGPDIAEQLERASPRRIHAIFLTHAHSDASGGMRALSRWLGTHMPSQTMDVHAHPSVIRRLRTAYADLQHFRYRSLRPYATVRVGRLSITPFPVRHSMTPGFPTFGFVFGKRFAYASDVASLPAQSKRMLKNTNTLALDGAMWFGSHIASHLSAPESITLAGKLGVRRLILTQIGHSYPPHEDAEKTIRTYMRSCKTAKPKSAFLAFDGMKIRLNR